VHNIKNEYYLYSYIFSCKVEGKKFFQLIQNTKNIIEGNLINILSEKHLRRYIFSYILYHKRKKLSTFI
jgi:hypothetical protein